MKMFKFVGCGDEVMYLNADKVVRVLAVDDRRRKEVVAQKCNGLNPLEAIDMAKTYEGVLSAVETADSMMFSCESMEVIVARINTL